jgi:hypothetical protein
MPTTRLDTDYLILGAGAMSMAFADVILTEHRSARLVIVDRHADPGGHWNDSYPFVRLHQPAAYYGLRSTRLGRGGADLASGAEIVAYYRYAMDRFVATGRVRFLSMSEYRGDGRVVSMVEPDHVTEITAYRRIVDGTYMTVQVPSVNGPRYAVDPDVTVVAPNDLVRLTRPRERYVVVGAGKTGIDAILFLLDQGVSPKRIQWIVSHDSWLWDRATVQPGHVLKTLAAQVRSIVDAASVDDVFLRLERQGIVLRVDTGVMPSKWRCATIDRRELTALRQIDDVVRMGRVQRVGRGEILLDGGGLDAADDSLIIDCSSNGLAKITPTPLFSDGRITLQSTYMCQQTFSAAVTARVELLDTSDAKRNRLCAPVPHPELNEDMLPCLLTSARNLLNCSRHAPLWLRRSRLNPGNGETLHQYLERGARIALLQRKAIKSTNALLASPGAPA